LLKPRQETAQLSIFPEFRSLFCNYLKVHYLGNHLPIVSQNSTKCQSGPDRCAPLKFPQT